MVTESVELAKRRAVPGHRQHGASREVDADADHVLRPDSSGFQPFGDSPVEDLQVVTGVLQCGVRRQLHAGQGQPGIDHALRVRDLGDRDLFSGAQIEKKDSTRHRSEVDANRHSPVARRR